MFIVEIKNSGEKGYEACRILSETLEQYPKYKEQIVVGTFHDEIEEELKAKYGDFACLQIPTSYDLGIELELDKKTIIKRAHRRNVAVQYWTINEAEDMRELIELGCDCIMTDNPKLLKSVLEEYR